MKRTKFTLVLGLMATIAVVISCKDANKGTKISDAKEVSEHQSTYKTYTVDTDKSHIAWVGSTPIDGHNGTIKLSSGQMGVENGQLKSGSFQIDMNTIEVLDLKDAEENSDLVGHLKNEDFFEVDKFPKGQFDIVSVTKQGDAHTVKGNLMLKDIIKNISFPVDLSVQGENISMISKSFSIDRTEWGIIYDSGTFFKDLKDEFIKDEIEITLNITGSLE